jgi:aminodeoxyfutalosine deaminase
MPDDPLSSAVAALPKAELHLHLEGSISPAAAVELAARRGHSLTEDDVRARYSYRDFRGFLDAFKWVTSYLREPADYAFIARRLAEDLIRQNVLCAEITLSVAVMRLREQDADANFAALAEVAAWAASQGLHLAWIFDTTRQFGAAAAVEVARLAAKHRSEGVVAFGMGGDELSFPAADFKPAFSLARGAGLHTVCHAGEIGTPRQIREAVEILAAERIGHGLAVIHDDDLRRELARRRIPLELCPASNFRTGALARQLGKPDPRPDEHPLAALHASGSPVVISTDDPAMFHTTLLEEYAFASRAGIPPSGIAALARRSFEFAFLPVGEKSRFLALFDLRARDLLLV